jgi:hypothetical protein
MTTKYIINYVDRFTGEEERLYCTEERLNYVQAQLKSDGKEIQSVSAQKQ